MAKSRARQKPLNLIDRPKRMLSVTQAYSKLYIKPEMKGVIATEWQDHVAKNPDMKDKRMSHYNTAVQGLYNAESDEVKAEVERRY